MSSSVIPRWWVLAVIALTMAGNSWAGVGFMDYYTPGQNQFVVTTDSDSVLLSVTDPDGRTISRDIKEVPTGIYRAIRRKGTMELVAVQILVPKVVYGKYVITIAAAPGLEVAGTYNLTYYFMGTRHDLVDNGPIPEGEPHTFTVDLQNLPPEIISHPRGWAEVGEVYTYEAVVEDLERDPVTFEAVSLAEGMLFDEDEGILTWTPTLVQLGRHDISVAVTDTAGNRVGKRWSLEVGLGQPGNPQAVNRCDHVLVTWEPVPGAAEYLIQRTSPKQREPFEVTAAGSSFADGRFVPDDTITYIVYAVDAQGRQGGQNTFAVVRTPVDADGDRIMDGCREDCDSRGISGEMVALEGSLKQPDGTMREVNLTLFPTIKTEGSWKITGVDIKSGSRVREPFLPVPSVKSGQPPATDYEITGPLSLKLRAARNGAEGRTYRIRAQGMDCAGAYNFETEVQVPGLRPANAGELKKHFASVRQRIATLKISSTITAVKDGVSSQGDMKLIYKPGFGVVEGNRAPDGLTNGTTLLSAYDLLEVLGFTGAGTTSGKNRWKAQGHERTSGMLIGAIINPSDQYYISVELAGDTYTISPEPAEGTVSRIVVFEDLLTVAKLVYPMEVKEDRYTVTVTYGGHRTVAGFVFPGTVSIEVPKLGWKVLINHEDIRVNEDLKEISPADPPVGVNR